MQLLIETNSNTESYKSENNGGVCFSYERKKPFNDVGEHYQKHMGVIDYTQSIQLAHKLMHINYLKIEGNLLFYLYKTSLKLCTYSCTFLEVFFCISNQQGINV